MTASHGSVISGPLTARFALLTTLVLRACVNGAFTMWLLTRQPIWADIFWVGSSYAIADGVLGVITGTLLGRHALKVPPILVAMVLADGVLRVVSGVAIRLFDGVPHAGLPTVLFFGALGTWAALGGLAALVGWFVAHRFHRETAGSRSHVHALFDPFSVGGLVALGLAVYALVVGPPINVEQLRVAGAVACAAMTFIFLAASAGEAHTSDLVRAA